MSTDFCKVGFFSDGGGRIRVVKQGYVADPAPSDPRVIIFDSDWPDVLQTAPGYFGTAAYNTSSPTFTVSFGALSFAPFVQMAMPITSYYISGRYMSAYLYGVLGGAYYDVGAPVSVTTSSFTFSQPTRIDGSAPPAGSIAWVALVNDPTILAAGVSRAGTGTWMRLDKNGPVIAKPGKNIGSTNYTTDYLIPPVTVGTTLFQPFMSGTVSSLPWIDNSVTTLGQGASVTHETYGEYLIVIPHNLGYIPIVLSTAYTDFRSASVQSAVCAVDATNIYLFTSEGPSGTTGSTLAINPTSYFVLPARWF